MMNQQFRLTPFTLTVMLAYVQYYTPNFLPGRCLPATDLRRLAGQIGAAVVGLRSARAHPLLAMHLALAEAAGLLSVAGGRWQTTTMTLDWLAAGVAEQSAWLLAALKGPDWSETLARLSLTEVFRLDYLVYIEQTLARWPGSWPAAALANWLPAADDPAIWRLRLPETLPTSHLFDLLQLGRWVPGEEWQASAYTVAMAAQRGYTPAAMERLLQAATGQPPGPARQQQLWQWYRQHDAVQIERVYLLTVKEPARLDHLLGQRRLGSHIGQQLSPRHALVSPRIIPSLRRQLAREGLALQAPAAALPEDDTAVTRGMAWLGLRLLLGLGKWLPLPLPKPYADLHRLAGGLDAAQLADLEQKAAALLAEIRNALRGRDAYFPPEEPVAAELVTAVRQALADGYLLAIAYQGLGELLPRYRTVQPLRLTERDGLYYLTAYCYLAEANRVFRLDRITTYQVLPEKVT
jgi:hypothetical protein